MNIKQLNLKRRQFVALTSGLLGSPLFAIVDRKAGNAPLFLSAASDSDDRHWVIGFTINDEKSILLFKHQLPGRAHHIAVNESLGFFLVIARRPGNYLWLGDLEKGTPLAEFTVPADRHLYGHGVFTNDGRTFYAPENAWQLIYGDSGRVVAWELSRDGNRIDMSRKRDYPSYGTGPHELLLKPDQKTLVVANGGIRTHPDHGRDILNIDSMLPSLAYLDAATGDLQEQHFLDGDYHKASIRHLDQNIAGLVVLGMQYEGEPFDRTPLVALHNQGEPLRPLWAPESLQGQMSQYVGAVRFDSDGRYFSASCPRGNMITFWDSTTGELINSVRSRDGCGICAVNDGFLFSVGNGRVSYMDLAADAITEIDMNEIDKVFWDNHLSMLAF